MKPWKLSDGTVVHLGGEVEGGTLFAQQLRAKISDPETVVPVYPLPASGLPLDVNDAAILDAFVRIEAARPCDAWLMVSVLDAPDVPDLPPPPWGDEPDAHEGRLILY